jgi:hypothetical protein
LYASPNIVRVIKSRRIRWVVHVAYMGGIISAYIILVGKPERKKPLRKPRHKWEYNIRVDLGDQMESVDWMHLVQDKD